MATTNPDDDPRLDSVKRVQAAVTRTERKLEALKVELVEEVAKAAKDGVKPGPLMRVTGKSAETIRQWRAEHGAEPLRPPTSGGFKPGRKTDSADA